MIIFKNRTQLRNNHVQISVVSHKFIENRKIKMTNMRWEYNYQKHQTAIDWLLLHKIQKPYCGMSTSNVVCTQIIFFCSSLDKKILNLKYLNCTSGIEESNREDKYKIQTFFSAENYIYDQNLCRLCFFFLFYFKFGRDLTYKMFLIIVPRTKTEPHSTFTVLAFIIWTED